MLLTIRTTHKPATDLGYLLAKNPAKFQSFPQSFGTAHIFYPIANENECMVALLLEMDPVNLVREGNASTGQHALDAYINDRPYCANSFLTTALVKTLRSAMKGESKERPELAQTSIPLVINLPALRCKGGEALIRTMFEPLGYILKIVQSQAHLSEKHPEWGPNPYFDLTLEKCCRLSEVLNHLFILIPTLDRDKHYFTNGDEVEKLFASANDWISTHPERDRIVRWYLQNKQKLVKEAMDRFKTDEEPNESEAKEDVAQEPEKETISLNQQRYEIVLEELKKRRVDKVLDLGCGEGRFIKVLQQYSKIGKIAGMDVAVRSLEYARKRLRLDEATPQQQERINLFQSSFIYCDKRWLGYDGITAIEVIEHMELYHLKLFEEALFRYTNPNLILLSTPNREYNGLFPGMQPGKFRHSDHRFEWTRAEFSDWVQNIASTYGYTAEIRGIGQEHPELGFPTQMVIFTK